MLRPESAIVECISVDVVCLPLRLLSFRETSVPSVDTGLRPRLVKHVRR